MATRLKTRLRQLQKRADPTSQHSDIVFITGREPEAEAEARWLRKYPDAEIPRFITLTTGCGTPLDDLLSPAIKECDAPLKEPWK